MQKINKLVHLEIIGWLFFALVLWRLILLWIYPEQSINANLAWAASYQLLAWYGVVSGFFVAKQWGGYKSVFGRAITFFALGLLFQAGGQTTFSLYNLVFKIEVPYPSVADFFYFGSIPFYILGSWYLGKAAGNIFTLKSFVNKAQAIFLPAFLLLMSYEFFLRSYEFDWNSPLKILLDFGYPFGQTIYVAIALVTYLLSKKILGGLMRNRVLFILIALGVQYLADYNFLFQAQNGTWVNGAHGDFIYLVAYLLMAIGLTNLAPDFIRHDNQVTK